MTNDYSVLVRDVDKSYGKTQILKKLSMKVGRGEIYGLLGSSGCGKTTLLSTIVGRKRIDGGEIWVFGAKPGDPESGIPGPKVGYMPQEIALVGEFTVRDAIFYFGRIFYLEEKVIEERFRELSDLLDLPPDKKFLRDCSGGQKRRVSFAVALVHKPKLLILDEPTAGIDPLLREKIWSYLIDITKKEQLSVIITTHYIEECREADKIGLLRDGYLLTEDSPDNLLKRFNTQTLEEVFLILSRRQEAFKLVPNDDLIKGDKTNKSKIINYDLNTSLASIESVPDEHKTNILTAKSTKAKNSFFSLKHLKSLLDKNIKQFYRNPTAVFFLLSLPILQTLFLVYSLGLNMRNIPIGIVNDEGKTTFCPDFSLEGTVRPDNESLACHFHNLSCRFLKYHLSDPMIVKREYDSLEKAVDDVKHGKLYGVMYIPENYSESLENRLDSTTDVSDDVLEFSSIQVRLDMSNSQVGISVKNKLLLLYFEFQKAIFKDCDYVEGYGKFPVQAEYLYGSLDEPYQVFVIPGILITMMFFFGSMMTSLIIITEKDEGIWDRSIVAGVSSLEIIVSHLLFQSFIVIFQALEMVILIYCIYQYEYVGSIYLIYLLIYLQGLVGMSFGLLISVISTNVTMATNATMGFYLPMTVLSGALWPIEGMPKALQVFAKMLPVGIPIQSLVDIVKKGFSIDTFRVAIGFGASIGWIIFFTLLSVFFLKIQR